MPQCHHAGQKWRMKLYSYFRSSASLRVRSAFNMQPPAFMAAAPPLQPDAD
jgi:hypothetical protein